jgi:hypothetical protein
VATGAVALAVILGLTGVVSQGLHHLTSATTTVNDAALDAGFHVPPFLNAEAATMPMLALDYTLLEVERDGDAAAGPDVVRVNPGHLDEHCEYCFKIVYSPYLAGKAGIAWKTAQPLDVQGAERMVFWAKGEYGGEQIRVKILGKPSGTDTSIEDENLFDHARFVSASETITLTSRFQVYQVEVPNVDAENFNDITYPVAVEIDGGSGPTGTVAVYLKGFIFDGTQPKGVSVLENAEILEANVTSTT